MEGSTAAADALPSSSGPAATPKEAAIEPGQPTVFVSFREVKGPPLTSRAKKPSYIKRFYLVDSHGNETLAATGEDQGDAHYIYRNTEQFGGYGILDCHNRKELVAWLDRIKKQSQDAAGFHLIEDPPDQVLAASPVGSPVRHPNYPPFVAYRQEKFAYEDGHRGQKWYLVDESGHEQLAVTAEERETRDGHYTYKAEGPLAHHRPLLASNMGMVQEWLEQMLQHPSNPHLEDQATLGSGKLDRGKLGASGPLHRRSKPSASEHSSTFKKLLTKRALADPLHSEEAKRQKLQALEGTEAGDKELVGLRLRKLAASESIFRKSSCKAALKWLQAPAKEGEDEELNHMKFWVGALRLSVASLASFDNPGTSQPETASQNGDPSSSRGQPPTRLAALLDAVEALREICAHQLSLPTLAETGVVQDLLALRSHKEPSISGLATRALQQIRAVVSSRITILTKPEYLADPVAAAEATLRAAAAKFAARQAAAQQPNSLVRGIAAQLQQSLMGTPAQLGLQGPAAGTPASLSKSLDVGSLLPAGTTAGPPPAASCTATAPSAPEAMEVDKQPEALQEPVQLGQPGNQDPLRQNS